MSEQEIQRITDAVHKMEVRMAALPGEISEMIEKKCITRQEFRTAKGALAIVAAAVSGFVSVIAYILGFSK